MGSKNELLQLFSQFLHWLNYSLEALIWYEILFFHSSFTVIEFELWKCSILDVETTSCTSIYGKTLLVCWLGCSSLLNSTYHTIHFYNHHHATNRALFILEHFISLWLLIAAKWDWRVFIFFLFERVYCIRYGFYLVIIGCRVWWIWCISKGHVLILMIIKYG